MCHNKYRFFTSLVTAKEGEKRLEDAHMAREKTRITLLARTGGRRTGGREEAQAAPKTRRGPLAQLLPPDVHGLVFPSEIF